MSDNKELLILSQIQILNFIQLKKIEALKEKLRLEFEFKNFSNAPSNDPVTFFKREDWYSAQISMHEKEYQKQSEAYKKEFDLLTSIAD